MTIKVSFADFSARLVLVRTIIFSFSFSFCKIFRIFETNLFISRYFRNKLQIFELSKVSARVGGLVTTALRTSPISRVWWLVSTKFAAPTTDMCRHHWSWVSNRR